MAENLSLEPLVEMCFRENPYKKRKAGKPTVVVGEGQELDPEAFTLEYDESLVPNGNYPKTFVYDAHGNLHNICAELIGAVFRYAVYPGLEGNNREPYWKMACQYTELMELNHNVFNMDLKLRIQAGDDSTEDRHHNQSSAGWPLLAVDTGGRSDLSNIWHALLDDPAVWCAAHFAKEMFRHRRRHDNSKETSKEMGPPYPFYIFLLDGNKHHKNFLQGVAQHVIVPEDVISSNAAANGHPRDGSSRNNSGLHSDKAGKLGSLPSSSSALLHMSTCKLMPIFFNFLNIPYRLFVRVVILQHHAEFWLLSRRRRYFQNQLNGNSMPGVELQDVPVLRTKDAFQQQATDLVMEGYHIPRRTCLGGFVFVLERSGSFKTASSLRNLRKLVDMRTRNLAGVINTLAKEGMNVVTSTLKGLKFSHQLQIFANTAVFIAVHGAGLTNMIFMRRGSSVVEITLRSRTAEKGGRYRLVGFIDTAKSFELHYFHADPHAILPLPLQLEDPHATTAVVVNSTKLAHIAQAAWCLATRCQ
eukprot:jgi/Bigna1/72145/fgenesh1_pg.18_\